jgi:hypothetical protein
MERRQGHMTSLIGCEEKCHLDAPSSCRKPCLSAPWRDLVIGTTLIERRLLRVLFLVRKAE